MLQAYFIFKNIPMNKENNFETFEEIFKQLDSCNFQCEAGKLENNLAYIKLKSFLSKKDGIEKEIEESHNKKVYQRLVAISLEQWNESKTDLSFHDWMRVRGLHMKDGFFKAVENVEKKVQLCTSSGCKEVSVGDYNGHSAFACEYHMKKWNDYFDENYN